jgi:hypothetical protein
MNIEIRKLVGRNSFYVKVNGQYLRTERRASVRRFKSEASAREAVSGWIAMGANVSVVEARGV